MVVSQWEVEESARVDASYITVFVHQPGNKLHLFNTCEKICQFSLYELYESFIYAKKSRNVLVILVVGCNDFFF